MNFFNKLISSYADDLIIKLSEFTDFPEEKYEIVVENKRLKEEMYQLQSKQFNTVMEENNRLRNEIDRLKDEKIMRLEKENQILRLNGSNGNNTLMIAHKEEIKPFLISKFTYVEGIFKYYYEDGTVGTHQMSVNEVEDVLTKLFPSAEIKIMGTELNVIAKVRNKYLSTIRRPINNYVNVSEVDDWIDEKVTACRKGITHDSKRAYY